LVDIAVTACVAYLVGAIPFGYLVGRLRGVDIFQHGCGNIGATNVGRVLGWRWGIAVFLMDFAKGALPTLAGLIVGAERQIEPAAAMGVVGGLAAFVGHLYPIYLGFRGGKGVATGAGVVAVLLPLPTLAALAAWIVVVAAYRYVSLASVAAAGTLCGCYFAITAEPLGPQKLILSLFCLVAVGLVVVKHRGNLARLWHGNENRLADKAIMGLITKTIHVLAVGLWFGMAVFFSFPVALSLFGSFETMAESPERPSWFPLPAEFKMAGLQKDQGTRAAGFAISPIFDHYFLWQGVCGLLAAVTAMSWTSAEPGRRVHAVRIAIVLAGLAAVVVGWPLERQVAALREARNNASDRLLEAWKQDGQATDSVRGAIDTAKEARDVFGQWHVWSLMVNFVTIIMVTLAMALTAQLPPGVGTRINGSGQSLLATDGTQTEHR
jgi:acyl-phosphate glycerol 3-phosphate acyltransferase